MIRTPVATRAAAAPISAASATVFIGGAAGLGTGRRRGGLARRLELLKQPLGVFVRRRLQQADGARHVLRHAEAGRVAPRERDARPGLAFVGGRLEVIQDAFAVDGHLSVDAALIDRLERALRRLAEGGGFPDQHWHRFTAAALAEQRGADRVALTGPRESREFRPQRCSVFAKCRLRGLTGGRSGSAPAEGGLSQLAERGGGLGRSLRGRA